MSYILRYNNFFVNHLKLNKHHKYITTLLKCYEVRIIFVLFYNLVWHLRDAVQGQ